MQDDRLRASARSAIRPAHVPAAERTRPNRPPAHGFRHKLRYGYEPQRSRTEVYGESRARGVYSAEFALPPERALAVSRSELRLEADHPAYTLATALPALINRKSV